MASQQEKVCLDCGTVGSPVKHTPGSIWIEIVLVVACLVIGLWTAPAGLAIIPLGFVYSIWRHVKRGAVCPMCKGKRLVPVDSPVGQEMLHRS